MAEHELDLYDFDKTVVPFDSGTLFTFFCTVRYPWIILVELPAIIIFGPLRAAGLIKMKTFKNACFSFVPFVPLKKAVKSFWNKYESYFYPWFENGTRDFAVISASPDFLLNEIAKRRKIENLICTRHNPKTGRIIGENCRGEQKVVRLKEYFKDRYQNIRIADVYSDSYRHDKYIFSLAAGSCYHIENGKPVKFDFKRKYQ